MSTRKMSNGSNVPPNDQPPMRPIMKRLQPIPSPGMGSRAAVLAYNTAATSSLRSTETVVAIDRATVFRLNSLFCERMIQTHFLLSPHVFIMNISTIMAHIRNGIEASTMDLSPYLEVNKNAVMLYDIESRWYALEEDSAILSTSRKYMGKKYDDVNLDFFSIHREAQKYNDLSELRHKLDTFSMQSLLQSIIFYLKHSWSELTKYQRYALCQVVRQNEPNLTVFDQLTWFGYDCLLRSNDNDLIKVAEYNRIVNNITGTPSNASVEDLAVDFGVNFTFSKDVIDACDKHFEKCPRKRMPYTKMFDKK